eukprot:jgi/Chlat1/1567/Chrsp123S01849
MHSPLFPRAGDPSSQEALGVNHHAALQRSMRSNQHYHCAVLIGVHTVDICARYRMQRCARKGVDFNQLHPSCRKATCAAVYSGGAVLEVVQRDFVMPHTLHEWTRISTGVVESLRKVNHCVLANRQLFFRMCVPEHMF